MTKAIRIKEKTKKTFDKIKKKKQESSAELLERMVMFWLKKK